MVITPVAYLIEENKLTILLIKIISIDNFAHNTFNRILSSILHVAHIGKYISFILKPARVHYIYKVMGRNKIHCILSSLWVGTEDSTLLVAMHA